MSVRSSVMDLFGEYVRYAGGTIGLTPLTDVLSALDIQPEAARAIMTRLRSEGWFTSERDGRQVSYTATTHLMAVLDEGRQRIFVHDDSPWTGEWHQVVYVVPEAQRTLREALRKRLTYLGFGSPAPSIWLSARDRAREVDGLMLDLRIDAGSDVRLTQLRSRSESIAVDRQIARRSWDLEDINATYRDWIRDWRQRVIAYRTDSPTGAAAFAERVALVGEFRKFPFSDPDLPRELLPAPWHGHAARELFEEGARLLLPEADDFFTRTTGLRLRRAEHAPSSADRATMVR